jgi:hypothetical protein
MRPFHEMPIVSPAPGTDQINVVYDRSFLVTASRHEGVPDLTPLQLEAMDLFESMAEKCSISMDLLRGDLQLVHNHQILHSRTEFVDDPALGEDGKRHMVRLWVSVPSASDSFSVKASLVDGRPLDGPLAVWFGLDRGHRGGFGANSLIAPVRPE